MGDACNGLRAQARRRVFPTTNGRGPRSALPESITCLRCGQSMSTAGQRHAVTPGAVHDALARSERASSEPPTTPPLSSGPGSTIGRGYVHVLAPMSWPTYQTKWPSSCPHREFLVSSKALCWFLAESLRRYWQDGSQSWHLST